MSDNCTKMKKNISFLLFSLFFLFSLFECPGQQRGANISFENMEHNFGKIREKNGSVSYQFLFTNTGSMPLIISNVQASCGCTSNNWTRSPILPGKKGYVSAIFNPLDRPGVFSKTIKVFSNSEYSSSVELKITGEVIEKPKSVEDFYPVSMGPLRAKTSHLALGNIKNSQIVNSSVEVINTSDSMLLISFAALPPYLKASVKPLKIKPRAKSVIKIKYNASLKNDFGFVSDKINFTINHHSSETYYFYVSASIEEDFSKLSPRQIADAPNLEFAETTYDFGTIKRNQKIQHDFVLTNKGKSDLTIHKVKTSCGCTTVNFDEADIHPGQSGMLKIQFDPYGKEGRQLKTINVITNDPKKPNITLYLKGNVEK